MKFAKRGSNYGWGGSRHFGGRPAKVVRGEKGGAERKTEERIGGDGDTEWLFGGGGRRGAEGRFERGRAKGRVGREVVLRAGLRLASL